jgi:hypothetical protein
MVPHRWIDDSNKVFSIQVAQQITVSLRSDPEIKLGQYASLAILRNSFLCILAQKVFQWNMKIYPINCIYREKVLFVFVEQAFK